MPPPRSSCAAQPSSSASSRGARSGPGRPRRSPASSRVGTSPWCSWTRRMTSPPRRSRLSCSRCARR
ncbi:hypothetical protein FM103_09075 [Corynebacterium xerosis]|nr:hypothetical protein FM103_09075 [Corynebacterium xerosis]